MDVLSDVLRLVRLEGALFFNAEFSAPWCVSASPSSMYVPHLCAGADRLIIFHFVTEGRGYARLPHGHREELAAGDIVVFPHGDAHLLGNGSPEKPVDSLQALAQGLFQGLKVTRFGGGGEITRFVCGYLACDRRLCDMILAGLPRIVKVPVGRQPSAQWLEHAIHFSVNGAEPSLAGSGLIVAKLSELLFLETLRCYINALPPEETGWLAGVRDPVVGQALALLHKEAEEPWTIAELARRTGVSRSRLTERFRFFLGSSPMAYLGRWRLKLAAEMLQSTDDTVAGIAAAVGYGSEPAFNRAFKREFDCPPAQFRRNRKSAATAAK